MIEEVEIINKRLKHRKDLKVIKKEALKNMIEGPAINFGLTNTFSKLGIDDDKQEDEKTNSQLEEDSKARDEAAF